MIGHIREYDIELLMQLRNKVYTILLVLLAVFSTLWVLFIDMKSHADAQDILAVWFFIILVCGVSYQLRQVKLWMAIYALFVGLILVFTFIVHYHPSESFLAFVPVTMPLAALLLGRRNTAILTIVILYLLVTSPINLSRTIQLAPYVVIIILSFITSTIIIQEFYGLLITMQDYQMYAIEQMREARERRSVLGQQRTQLIKSAEHLSYANRQLRIAKQKIAEAHKLKSQFAANVSHELRTPINLVVGFAETIMRFPNVYGRTLPTEYVSDIRTIYRNAKHLQTLINDVLDMSQLESGHMALVKESLKIDVVIYEAVNMLKDQISSKGLDLHLDIPEDLSAMWLDRVRMRQVFINLVANAIRFTDVGYISIRVYEEESNLIICVADTGTGIQEGEEDHIFEEFYQTNNINRRGEGSGLGLTLCRNFVQMHGGIIYAERQSVGSLFWIQLPIEVRSVSASIGELRALAVEKNSVLVYSADPKIAEFFERHLTKHNVISVQQIDLIELYVDANPIALVIDTQDYDRLVGQLDLRERMSRVPVITCPMPSGRQHMQTLGVADYLIKPVSADMLRLSIRNLTTPPKHILIVDDEREIVRLFARLLKAIVPDCRLTMAYSGQEALALLDSLVPDLILLDIIMPDVDGLTVLDIIKSRPELMHIPVIIASAKGASEAISPSEIGDFVVHMPREFQPMELLHAVESVVESLYPAL
jgi:signal transduction histidine kinase/CheY-like chemotaxis protein